MRRGDCVHPLEGSHPARVCFCVSALYGVRCATMKNWTSQTEFGWYRERVGIVVVKGRKR